MRFLDFLAASAIRGVVILFRILPVRFVLKLGRGLGGVFYLLAPGRRRIAYTNMRAAFSKEKSPEELTRMTKRVCGSFSEMIFELMTLSRINKKYTDKYVKIKNRPDFENALKEGRGVIFLTAHFGNWELSGMVSSIEGYPLYVLAREQNMKMINELINKLRESKGSKVVRKGITTRYIVKALHEGHIIGMVADQNAGPNGIIADFFGRPAPTAAGPYRFAAKTGAVIVPAFIVREKGPYHTLTIEKPISIGPKEDITSYVEGYNKLLEKYITTHYDHWLWFHRRWKQSPLKRVVILSDGRQGHANQSMAIAESFKKYRDDKNIDPANTSINVIDVKFKNVFWKNIIHLSSVFSGPWCQGCLRCLKYGLEKSSYDRLVKTHADVVISTGFSLAGVNSIFKYENNAKNAVIQKPGVLSFKKFNMVILPKHDIKDKPVKRENLFVTDIAPNLVNDKRMEQSKALLGKDIRKSDGRRTIGVLFGGDNANFLYDEGIIGSAAKSIINAAEKINADILITTSRRTDRKMEDTLRKYFSKEPSVKLMVVANTSNPPHAYSGILGMSDVIVVTGESVSMVSEAVSSGKRVVSFKGNRVSEKATKHDRFLDSLDREGYLKIASPDRIEEAIVDYVNNKTVLKKYEGADWIYKNMWRLGG